MPRSASADSTVTWEKSPAVAQVVACDPAAVCPAQPVDLGGGNWQGGVVLTEIMNNQSDPHGLGGYQLYVTYDPTVFQDAQIVDAGAVNDGGVRTTACAPAPGGAPGNIGMVCSSTGPFGVGATWSGPMVMAYVTLKLQPGVFDTIVPGPGGGIITTIRDSVRVTNTCGQPLNDGTIQPLPGQTECQGNLLPGLGANGTVLSPGNSTITIVRPPPTPTPSPTATATPTSTKTATPTPTRTPRTATSTSVPVTPAPTSSTVPVTASPGTNTTPPAPTRTATPCARRSDDWRGHPDDWPTDHLRIGRHDYTKDELLRLLNADSADDASLVLAQELITARLNEAAARPHAGADAFALADTLLSDAGDRLPFHQRLDDYRGRGMLWAAAALHRQDDECESDTVPNGRSPTAVSTVLGNTRKTLPSTGNTGPLRSDPTAWIITAMSIVIVSLLVVVFRQSVGDRDD